MILNDIFVIVFKMEEMFDGQKNYKYILLFFVVVFTTQHISNLALQLSNCTAHYSGYITKCTVYTAPCYFYIAQFTLMKKIRTINVGNLFFIVNYKSVIEVRVWQEQQ